MTFNSFSGILTFLINIVTTWTSKFRTSSEFKHQFLSIEQAWAPNSWIFQASNELEHQNFRANTSGHRENLCLFTYYPEIIIFITWNRMNCSSSIYWASNSSFGRPWAANIWIFWASSEPNIKIFEWTRAGIKPTDVCEFTISLAPK